MTESIEWLKMLILNHQSLQYLIVFLGAGFGGEFALLSLGFLAAQGIIPIIPLFVVSFLGTLFSDAIWFFTGKTSLVKKLITHRYANTTISIISQAINRVSRGNHLAALIMGKFLVGTRVLMIMYVGMTNISFVNFFRADIIATLIWLVVLIPIGFISGFGFTYLAGILENVYAAIGFILLIIIGFVMFEIWLKKMFTKNKEEL